MKQYVVLYKEGQATEYDKVKASYFVCPNDVLMLFNDKDQAIVAYKNWERIYEYVEKEKEANEE